MSILKANRRWQRVVVFGAAYLVLGIISAILTNPVQSETLQAVMRVGVLSIAVAVLLTHLHYEIQRFHNNARGASLLASGAVAFGTFFLAVYANLLGWVDGSEFRISLILAVLIWPIVTGLLTFPVALAVATLKARKRQ